MSLAEKQTPIGATHHSHYLVLIGGKRWGEAEALKRLDGKETRQPSDGRANRRGATFLSENQISFSDVVIRRAANDTRTGFHEGCPTEIGLSKKLPRHQQKPLCNINSANLKRIATQMI